MLIGKLCTIAANRASAHVGPDAKRPGQHHGDAYGQPGRACPTSILWLALLMLFILAANLAGCGFKLRGMADLPEQFDRTQLVGIEPFSDFGVTLRDAFKINGATLGASEEGATAVLRIEEASTNRKVLGVSGSGKAQSFQLTFRVRFSAKTADGETLLETQLIEQRQDYEYDPDELLSRENAEETATREMMRQASWRIIERLSKDPSAV